MLYVAVPFTFKVKSRSQVLNEHNSRIVRREGCSVITGSDLRSSRRAGVEYEGVENGHVVPLSSFVGLMNESVCDGAHNSFITTAKQLLVERLQIDTLEEGTILGVDYWSDASVLEHFGEGGRVGIREENRSRESGQHDIADLYAGRGGSFADGEVVCAEELRKVMEEK
jgi:hypothetical protein